MVKISFQENGTLTGAIKRDVMTIWRVTMELIKCTLLLGFREIKHTNFIGPTGVRIHKNGHKEASRKK